MKFDDAVEILVNIFTKSHRERQGGSEEKTSAILEEINYTLLASVLYSFFHVLLTADEMKDKVKAFVDDRYDGKISKLWDSCHTTLKKYKQRSEGSKTGGGPSDDKATVPLKRAADGVPVPVTAFLNSQDPTSPTVAVVGAGAANGAPFSPLNADGSSGGGPTNELVSAISDGGPSVASKADMEKIDAVLDEGAHWYELHVYINEVEKKLGGGSSSSGSSSSRAGGDERSSSTVAQLRKRLYHLRYEHPLKTEVIYNLLNLMLSQTNSEIFKAPLDPKTTMEYNKITAGPYDQVVFHSAAISTIKENVAASANLQYHTTAKGHAGKYAVQEPFPAPSHKRARVDEDATLHTVLYNYTSSINRVITIADLERCIYHISANCCFFNAPESFFPRCARGFAENCVFHLAQYCRQQLLL